MVDFGRVLTAMITPFKEDGSINYDVAAELAAHLVNNGTDTLVVCGTTGESPTLTKEEKYQIPFFRKCDRMTAGAPRHRKAQKCSQSLHLAWNSRQAYSLMRFDK